MTNIKALLKATGNEYASIAENGLVVDPAGVPIDTGSYTVNALLGGSIYSGLPANKITGLAGEQGVGKTFFAISIAKNFLESNPEAILGWFDTEAAVTSDMLRERVGNADRILYIPVNTVQEFQTQASKLLTEFSQIRESNPEAQMLFILDSMGNLSTTKEMTDIESGSETKDMTRAQLLKGAFRALILKLAKNQVPLLFTNHTYMEIGLFAKKLMSGGCLVAGTKILTKRGYVNIEEISTEDRVYTKEGTFERVTELHKFDDKDLIEIEFDDGYIVQCTPEHKFLIGDAWIKAKDLKIADSVAAV